MNSQMAEYGTVIVIRASKDTYLFLDSIDRKRYISIFVKMLKKNPQKDACAIIAGFSNDFVKIIFEKGCEEDLRSLLRRVHTSYASYRRTKNCPVKFERSDIFLLETEISISEAVKKLRNESDYICTDFYNYNETDIETGFLVKKESMHENITDSKILYTAQRYKKVSSIEEFIEAADSSEKRAFAKTLKDGYDISYREIGNILKCSYSTIYRMVNKSG